MIAKAAMVVLSALILWGCSGPERYTTPALDPDEAQAPTEQSSPVPSTGPAAGS